MHAPPANGRARRGQTVQSCFACQNAGTRCRTCTARDATASESAASGPTDTLVSQDSRVEPSATLSGACSSVAAASPDGSSAIPDQGLIAEQSAVAVVEHVEGFLSAPLREQQMEDELDGEGQHDREESDGEGQGEAGVLELGHEATPKPVGGEKLLPCQYGPVGQVLREEIIEKDVDRALYGWLPKMATSSKGSIGCVLASSFCERINSCANAVVTEGNTLLSDDEMELLVMLRMNKGFMEFMRTYYPHVARETFSLGTILTVEENKEHDDPEDDDTW